jgi:hypothetical protein
MLDKIIVSFDRKTVTLVYTDRQPMTLTSDRGLALELLDEFMNPITSECQTWSQYTRSLEDTQVLTLEAV